MFLDLNHPRHVHADARLRDEPILWLGTVRPDGRPHLVPVWFLWDGASIYIYSQPAAQKLRNLAANDRVTLALEAANRGGDIVIIEGTAEVMDVADAPDVIPPYTTKYEQDAAAMDSTVAQMLTAFNRLIRVTPETLRAW